MAYRVELTARAARDLRALYLRIHAADSTQARKWFEGLEQAILRLDENPSRCPAAQDDPALRHLLYGGGRDVYRILFEIEEARRVVWILHIRHGARAPLRQGEAKS